LSARDASRSGVVSFNLGIEPEQHPTTTRDASRVVVVSYTLGIEPEEHPTLAGAHRADSIGVAAPASSAIEAEPTAYVMAESQPPARAAADHGVMPRVALGGYCPVELSRNGRWTRGDLRWTVVYKGWIYRFSGSQQRQQFLANPDSFTPANSGNDPVLSVDENRMVPGQTAYCAQYDGRLYMFSSAVSQAQFNRSPQRYAAGR